MKEIILEGEQALQVIRCQAVLQALNSVLSQRIEDIIENGYTGDVTNHMSKETYTAVAIINEISAMSDSLNEQINSIVKTELDDLTKIIVEDFPKIKINKINVKTEE